MNTIPKDMKLKKGKLYLNGTNVAVTFSMVEQAKTEARQELRTPTKYNAAIARLFVLESIGLVNLHP